MNIGDMVTWTHISKRGKTISMKQREGVIEKFSRDGKMAYVKPTGRSKKVLLGLDQCQLVGSGKTQLTRFVEAIVANRSSQR